MVKLLSGHKEGVCVVSLGPENPNLGPDYSSFSHTIVASNYDMPYVTTF